MDDILLVDKPSGITSFDVIRILRKKLNVRKMGHAGTLDPRASGLMIVGVGAGTKKMSAYLKLPKEYVAEVLIGEQRTTGDLDGVIIEEKDVHDLARGAVEEALLRMVGVVDLPTPTYAAVKRGGEPLYKKARRGEVVVPPIRPMEITGAQLTDFSCQSTRCVAIITWSVKSGVYIRSLAEELGRRLGYPATLRALRRTRIGEFKVEDAEKVEAPPV